MTLDAFGIGPVAELLSKVFGFVVDPEGLAKMKREHKIQVINAAFAIAMDEHDEVAVDLLFAELRQLRAEAG
jgi:hypothetical protein